VSLESFSPRLVDEASVTRETADFTLDPEETAKGGRVVASLLDSLKGGDGRASTQDALDAIALVMSGGACSAAEFPWQQVRPHHGAAAMTFLREEGAPARIEHYLCSRDEGRKYQQVPVSYSRKDVQRYRTTLRKVLQECSNLGLVSEEEEAPEKARNAKEREVTPSEFRAVLSICDGQKTAESLRDSLILSLAYYGGLKIPELLALTVDDLTFDSTKSQVTVRIRTPKGQRNRTVPLHERSLMALEDWMERRGNSDGALLCPVGRGGRVETKRMTAAAVRLACQKWAEQAGVELFSPNDLRKSGSQAKNGKRRSRRDRRPISAGALALYGEDPDQEPHADLIQFPFRARSR